MCPILHFQPNRGSLPINCLYKEKHSLHRKIEVMFLDEERVHVEPKKVVCFVNQSYFLSCPYVQLLPLSCIYNSSQRERLSPLFGLLKILSLSITYLAKETVSINNTFGQRDCLCHLPFFFFFQITSITRETVSVSNNFSKIDFLCHY